MRPAAIVMAALWGLTVDAQQTVPAERALPESSLPIALVGVAIHPKDPAKSLAIFRCDAAEPAASLAAAPGERVCGLAEVVEVRSANVVISNLTAGRLEVMPILKSAPPTPPPALLSSPPSSPPDSPALVMGTLRKEAVAHYLAHLPAVLASALATPHYLTLPDGLRVIDGFEITGIADGSPIAELGLRTGDLIAEVDGAALDNVGRVLALLARAGSMTRIALTVIRRGERMTFVFEAK